jgi:hypothetical protein
MARIRSVHPGFFSDEAVVSCSAPARLLVIGLWGEADDKGVFEWKPRTLKMRVFPADDYNVDNLLAELVRENIVKRYEMEEKVFGAIRNFRRYQRPKKPNDIHPMPDELRTYVGLSSSSSVPVENRFGTGTEFSNQMEDGGWKVEEEGNNRHIHTGDIQEGTYTREELVDADGVVFDPYDHEPEDSR